MSLRQGLKSKASKKSKSTQSESKATKKPAVIKELEEHFEKPEITVLRGSLPKSGPLDFATKNSFPLFFDGEEALVGIY